MVLCEGVNLHQGHGGLIQAHNLALHDLHHLHDLGLRELIVAYRLAEDISGFKEGRRERAELVAHNLLQR